MTPDTQDDIIQASATGFSALAPEEVQFGDDDAGSGGLMVSGALYFMYFS